MVERTEELVTIFGGGGFIGRYVCEFLMKSGARVRIAQRNPRQAHIIQPLGQVGQFGFVRADITKAESVRRAIYGASAVVNLCGVFGSKMHGVHVDGARNVSEAARQAGAGALVQVSAIGASIESPSAYGRTKGEGEEAARSSFGQATIIRPSLVFGPEDALTNRFAAMGRLPAIPVIAAARRFQPVYVRDLAKAIAMTALDPQRFAGQTYEIGGPQVMSMVELHRAIFAISGQTPNLVEIADFVADLMSRFGFLPGAPLTRDQWLMLGQDNVPSGSLPGLEAFGIAPTPLSAVGSEWLGRYRGNRFAERRIHLTPTT